MTKTTVADWMTKTIVSVKPRDTVAHVRDVMAERRVNQIPVLKAGELVGIVTDRDIRDATPSVVEFAEGRKPEPRHDPARMAVEDVMTPEPLTIAPGESIGAAAALMRKQRIGSLPVLDGGRLVGLLTRSDLLDALVHLAPDA